MKLIAALALAFAAGTSSSAQWLKQTSPGLPRMADGTPDLKAPTPRAADGKPDLTGIWEWRRFYYNVAEDLKPEDIQPWARELVKRRMDSLGTDDPASFGCLPLGPRLNLYPPLLAKIIQSPSLIVMLSEGLAFRQIFLDGRKLPQNPNPSFMGYSVGHWEDDTLVIDSTGFKDTTWLDQAGNPHTESLSVTERIRRPSIGRLEVDETLIDSAIYAKALHISLTADLVADTELLEYVCAENERDHPHLIGKASDVLRKVVQVPIPILQRYVGAYELRTAASPDRPNVLQVRLVDGSLSLEGRALTPLSETRFSGTVQVEFIVGEQQKVTHMILHVASGDIKAVRVADDR